MDIVVNNIADEAMLYRNTANDTHAKPAAEIVLKGDSNNIHATGARVVLFSGSNIRTYEKYPVHGFLGSMETPLHIGLDSVKIDSAFLIWPDDSFQKINISSDTTAVLHFEYQHGLPMFDYSILTTHYINHTAHTEDITKSTGLLYKHEENPFNEFDREPLIPFMVSREGPALAVGDVNKDGLDDVFMGSSKTKTPALFIQNPNGSFYKSVQPALAADSMYEEVAAVLTDINNDGNTDLVVADGGNEYYGKDIHQQPRAFINDGKGSFSLLPGAFKGIYLTASCVAASDFNGDGNIDLFFGGRAVPFAYAEIPQSYLLMNDGRGNFTDVTAANAPQLAKIGLVRDAHWDDMDKDGKKDLTVVTEWDGIYVFKNNKGNLEKKTITDKNGWWNFVLPVDIDNDGDLDFIAGNLGLNSRFNANEREPVRLYYNDFDDNGQKEQLLTYYIHGRELPFATKAEFDKRLPALKKHFLYAEDFAKASLEDLFTKQKLSSSEIRTADYFANAVIINNGNFNFTVKELPWQAQLTSYRAAAVVDANNDTLPDILLCGNFYETNIQMGRYDADYGTILMNKGKGNFECSSLNGLVIKGQVRNISPLRIHNEDAFILTRNNDSAMVIKFGGMKER